jgi:tRNA 2-selenouridine synthase
MVHEINIEDYFNNQTALIDVRSPGEFKKGHIPHAVNIPLFSDAERAHIGTVYVKVSQEKATELAYNYVKPKLTDFVVRSKKNAPDGSVTIHCWRGGMRSQLFAEHLHKNGFAEISVITGGYKAYRNFVLHSFEKPLKLKIIGGYTGSGKTYIIRHFRRDGLQIVDLEELARHKGSAFGHIGQQNQPTAEQFENNLFEVWQKLDHSQPIWIEDESRNIGGVNIPMQLYHQMQNSPLYFLDIPREERARHLVSEYVDTDSSSLAESIHRITKRLGGLNTNRAIQFLNEKNYFETAMVVLHYYDKSYLKGLHYRHQANIFIINATKVDPAKNTKTILKLYKQHERNKVNTV